MRYVVAVLLLVALAAGFVFEYEPLRVNYRAALADRERMKNQLELMRTENERLTQEILRMKSDPFYIEKYAREAFGLAGSNEIIYRFDERKGK